MKYKTKKGVKSFLAFAVSFLLVFSMMPQLSFAQENGTGGATVYLEGEKYYKDSKENPKEFKDGDFTFKAVSSDGQTASGTSDKDGHITFDPMTFYSPGIYTVNVTENKGVDPNIVYDSSTKTVTVTVTNGAITGGVFERVNPSRDEYSIPPSDVVWLHKGNEYVVWYNPAEDLAQVKAALAAEKGPNAPPGFKVDGDYLYVAGFPSTGTEITVGGNTFTYVFEDGKLKLTSDNGADVAGQSNLGYVNFTHELVKKVAGSVIFNNLYKPFPAETSLEGTKEMTGRDLNQGETFDFILSGGNLTEPMTVQNVGDTFAFPNLTFEEPGDYTFTLTEGTRTSNGVTNDTSVYHITYTVEDVDGQLYAGDPVIQKAITGSEPTHSESIVFTNDYEKPFDSDGVFVGGEKNLTGRPLMDGEFQFQLWDSNSESDEPLQTVSNVGKYFTFEELVYTTDDLGGASSREFYYEVTEVIPEGAEGNMLNGVEYDPAHYYFMVEVTQDDEGEVTAELGWIKDHQEQEVEKMVFNNHYTPDPVDVTIEGHKVFTNGKLMGRDFNFGLYNDNEMVAMTANDAEGHFSFTVRGISQLGMHEYMVAEIMPEVKDPNITYDENKYPVWIDVTANEDGSLNAQVVYPEDNNPLTFVNRYIPDNPPDPTGTVKVTKDFYHNDLASNFTGTFTVGLYTDSDLTVKAKYADGTTVEGKAIDMGGNSTANVVFANLPYGTYYVAELGADGTPLVAGDVTGKLVQNAFKQVLVYEDQVISIGANQPNGEGTVVNKFYTEDFFLLGSITVTKKVTLNGDPFDTNKTYYAALFADEDFTELASEVMPIVMNANSHATIEFTDLEMGTYYVAETDKYGNLLDPEENGIEEIEIVNEEIVLGDDVATGSATIINKYVDEDFYYEDVKTGDDSNLGVWFTVLLLAGIAMASSLFFRRKDSLK